MPGCPVEADAVSYVPKVLNGSCSPAAVAFTARMILPNGSGCRCVRFFIEISRTATNEFICMNVCHGCPLPTRSGIRVAERNLYVARWQQGAQMNECRLGVECVRQQARSWALAITAFLVPVTALAQQAALQDFTQVEYYWAQDPGVFQSLWKSARELRPCA